jgi:hypothetical protein
VDSVGQQSTQNVSKLRSKSADCGVSKQIAEQLCGVGKVTYTYP